MYIIDLLDDFVYIKKKIDLLIGKEFNPDVIKHTITSYNEIIKKIGSYVYNFPFKSINIESLYGIHSIESFQTFRNNSNYKLLRYYNSSLEDKRYKYVNGINVMIYFNITKTKKELKVIIVNCHESIVSYNISELLPLHIVTEIYNYFIDFECESFQAVLHDKLDFRSLYYNIIEGKSFNDTLKLFPLFCFKNNKFVTITTEDIENKNLSVSFDEKYINIRHIYIVPNDFKTEFCLEGFFYNHKLIFQEFIITTKDIRNLLFMIDDEKLFYFLILLKSKLILFNPYYRIENIITVMKNKIANLFKFYEFNNENDIIIIDNRIVSKKYINNFFILKFFNHKEENVINNLFEYIKTNFLEEFKHEAINSLIFKIRCFKLIIKNVVPVVNVIEKITGDYPVLDEYLKNDFRTISDFDHINSLYNYLFIGLSILKIRVSEKIES